MRRPRLAVLVVSYNVRDLLRNCLRSVAAAAVRSAHHLEVVTIVVDNASKDGSAAMVAREFPDVRLHASAENLGFTGGNNLALRLLGLAGPAQPERTDGVEAEYVLLLNPDTEVLDDALGQMVAFLESHPEAAACGPSLRYADGSFQHSAFHFPGLLQVLFDLFPPAALPGTSRLLNSRLNGRYPATCWQNNRPFVVDFVLGAALLVRSRAILTVGLLDERYWMYCEEMDWCRRLRAARWSIYILPTAQIVHHEAQSSRQRRWRSCEQLGRSRLRYFHQYAGDYPPPALWLIRILVHFYARQQLGQLERRFAQGTLDGVEWEEAIAALSTLTRLSTPAGSRCSP